MTFSLSTTTTSFSKIRGFSIDLLFLLKGRGLRTIEVVGETGKYHHYVSRYLYNLRNYGLVSKEGSFWNLTSEGSQLISYLESISSNSNNNNNVRKKVERKTKESRKKDESSNQKKTRQVSFSLWLENSGISLNDAESKMVEVLLDHFEKTKSKFIYVQDLFDLAGRVKISPDMINPVLMKLKEDNIVYNIRDNRHGAEKIGLYKDFIERLRADRIVNS